MVPGRRSRQVRFGRREWLLGLPVALLCSLTLAAPASAATETFNYTGAAQTWTVPAGVTSASFDLLGAQGGGDSGGNPGFGGRATATIPVTAGASIQVNVGGQPRVLFGGRVVGGFNGGGNPSRVGTGGGGASDIRIGGTTLDQRVLVAGGGGGGGNCLIVGPPQQTADGGGGGGLNGADGFVPALCQHLQGGGGTQTMGGSAGLPGLVDPGSFGSGANGGDNQGGGGGGGWYGGGGGVGISPGGGGSGHGPSDTVFETGVRSGNGQVTITYSLVPTSKDQCKNGGWENLRDSSGKTFKNQGACVSFVVAG